MTVSIGAYVLCDGTLENGVAISDLRINQTRSTDIAPIIPKPFRISQGSAGTGYSVPDFLTITADGESATIEVLAIGLTGNITAFTVTANDFSDNHSGLSASGGTGSGATFSASSSAIPNTTNPKAFERYGRPCQYTFMVKRTHSSLQATEQFILALENNIPTAGAIGFSTTGPEGSTDFVIPNGKVQSHELNEQSGQMTVHTYTIIGGSPVLA